MLRMFHKNMLTCALQYEILRLLVLLITNNTNNTNDPSYTTKLNILLHGDARLNFQENKELFQAIHVYISSTERFS